MTKSMTGYGRAEFSVGEDNFVVELKSLNHRYLEVNSRIPDRFFSQDIKIREFIKSKFSRGAFSVNISKSGRLSTDAVVNLDLAKSYIDASLEIKHKLGLEGDLDINSIMKLRDILISSSVGEVDSKKDWQALAGALEASASDLRELREKEGAKLKKDIIERLVNVSKQSKLIDYMTESDVDSYRLKITERIKGLIGEFTGDELDEKRIITEAALLAEKTNITEEVVRLGIHIEKMKEFLNEEPSGRKCDFLCQELLREINTVGSKTDRAEVTSIVVGVKGELEKIREQVQNIE